MKKSKVVLVKCQDYNPKNIRKALKEIFEVLGEPRVLFEGNSLLIKPNLCLSAKPMQNITTNPAIIRELILLLKNEFHLTIGESHIGNLSQEQVCNLWEETGFRELLSEFHIKGSNFSESVNNHDVYTNLKYEVPLSDLIFENEIINVPKLKTHGYMLLTACIKNAYGFLPGNSKKHFHKEFQDYKQFAHFISSIYKKSNIKLNIVDAITCIEGNGPGVKGQPRHLGLIVAGEDGFAVDRVLSVLIGLKSSDVMTNKFGYIFNKDIDDFSDIELLGESIEQYRTTFKLPDLYTHKVNLISKMFYMTKNSVEIDQDKCIKCGQCAKNCPNSAISLQNDKYTINAKRCMQCYVCDETCLNFAIRKKEYSLIKNIKYNKNGG